MAMSPKKLLKAQDFDKALNRLDLEMSKDSFLIAFAPINVISAGGFLAVKLFKNRETTGDLDYMIEPQWAQDDEIKYPLQKAIRTVARTENFEREWMNNGLEIWATPEARKTLFEQSYRQNIVLFKGQTLKIWAAPLEWALERKLRRIAYSDRGEKNVDMEDALALFGHFRAVSKRPLDMEYFRNLNMNGFDRVPERNHMEMVAANYQKKYKEDLFSSPTAPAGGSGTVAWSEWSWSEERGCHYRARENAAEPNGFEYEYGPAPALSAANSSSATSASYVTPNYPIDNLVGTRQETQIGESSTTGNYLQNPQTLGTTGTATSPTTASPTTTTSAAPVSSQTEQPYYYVHEGKYYYWNNQEAIEVARPENVWVKNSKGWSETNREKYWRFWDGKKTLYQ